MVHSVRDVMTRDVVTVTPATPFKQVVRLLHEHRVTAEARVGWAVDDTAAQPTPSEPVPLM
jgi:CBS domain-containing protein